MAKVDIILTLYNIEKQYVDECIESLYNQTFQDFRIIAIDDCSTKIDYLYLSDKDKIFYVRNERNLGMCKSVNKGFNLVDAIYCVRLGSDDKFQPTLLEKEVNFLDNNPDYVGVCCEFQNFGKLNSIIHRAKVWDLSLVKKGVDYGFAGGMMFRASVLKYIKLNTSFPVCEDYDFHVRLMRFGKIHPIHEPLYLYRRHDKQTVCNRKMIEFFHNKVIRDFKI